MLVHAVFSPDKFLILIAAHYSREQAFSLENASEKHLRKAHAHCLLHHVAREGRHLNLSTLNYKSDNFF